MHGTLGVRQVSLEGHDVHGTLSILMKIEMKVKVKNNLNA
jgi:hypothetical protein